MMALSLVFYNQMKKNKNITIDDIPFPQVREEVIEMLSKDEELEG